MAMTDTPESISKTASRALHLATWCGAEGVVRYLLAQGTDVDVCDIHGVSALQIAVRRDNRKVVREVCGLWLIE
jgi:ankyrin repeat protein